MTTTKHFSNSRFAYSTHLVFTLCVLCALCGYSSGQDFKQVHPGVEHAQVTKEISGLNVKINLLRLDLKKVRLDVHHAFDKAIGMETTSSIAKRHSGVAAINAGFFRLDSSIWAGDAAGILRIDSRLISESTNNRVCLMINNLSSHTEVVMENVTSYPVVIKNTLAKKGQLSDRINWFPSGINRERKSEDFIVFTPEFGRTTLTEPGGKEIAVSSNRVTEIVESGSTFIPFDGFVISVSGKFIQDVESIRKGDGIIFGIPSTRDRASLSSSNNRLITSHEDITNGVPQLIRDGKIDITWEQEKASKSFVETRHPRTAVAKLKDGKFLMVTVDGRSESSGGISLQDLAEYLLSLGAVDAMNLDGGGSTTMYLDGKVVNNPSDKEGERKIGDAIVVTLRNKKK